MTWAIFFITGQPLSKLRQRTQIELIHHQFMDLPGIPNPDLKKINAGR